MCHSLPVTIPTRGHLIDGYMSKWPALALIVDTTTNDHLWLPYTLLRERHIHFGGTSLFPAKSTCAARWHDK